MRFHFPDMKCRHVYHAFIPKNNLKVRPLKNGFAASQNLFRNNNDNA